MSTNENYGAKLAHDVADLISSDRACQHGDKARNHFNIATMWNAYLRIRRDPAAPLSALDASQMMSLLKIARTQEGDYNPDDHADHIGYAAVAAEIAHREQIGDTD